MVLLGKKGILASLRSSRSRGLYPISDGKPRDQDGLTISNEFTWRSCVWADLRTVQDQLFVTFDSLGETHESSSISFDLSHSPALCEYEDFL